MVECHALNLSLDRAEQRSSQAIEQQRKRQQETTLDAAIKLYEEALSSHAAGESEIARAKYETVTDIIAWAKPSSNVLKPSPAPASRSSKSSRLQSHHRRGLGGPSAVESRGASFAKARRLLHLTHKNAAELAIQQGVPKVAVDSLLAALRSDAGDAASWLDMASFLQRYDNHQTGAIKYALQTALTIAKLKAPHTESLVAQSAFTSLMQFLRSKNDDVGMMRVANRVLTLNADHTEAQQYRQAMLQRWMRQGSLRKLSFFSVDASDWWSIMQEPSAPNPLFDLPPTLRDQESTLDADETLLLDETDASTDVSLRPLLLPLPSWRGLLTLLETAHQDVIQKVLTPATHDDGPFLSMGVHIAIAPLVEANEMEDVTSMRLNDSVEDAADAATAKDAPMATSGGTTVIAEAVRTAEVIPVEEKRVTTRSLRSKQEGIMSDESPQLTSTPMPMVPRIDATEMTLHPHSFMKHPILRETMSIAERNRLLTSISALAVPMNGGVSDQGTHHSTCNSSSSSSTTSRGGRMMALTESVLSRSPPLSTASALQDSRPEVQRMIDAINALGQNQGAALTEQIDLLLEFFLNRMEDDWPAGVVTPFLTLLLQRQLDRVLLERRHFWLVLRICELLFDALCTDAIPEEAIAWLQTATPSPIWIKDDRTVTVPVAASTSSEEQEEKNQVCGTLNAPPLLAHLVRRIGALKEQRDRLGKSGLSDVFTMRFAFLELKMAWWADAPPDQLSTLLATTRACCAALGPNETITLQNGNVLPHLSLHVLDALGVALQSRVHHQALQRQLDEGDYLSVLDDLVPRLFQASPSTMDSKEEARWPTLLHEALRRLMAAEAPSTVASRTLAYDLPGLKVDTLALMMQEEIADLMALHAFDNVYLRHLGAFVRAWTSLSLDETQWMMQERAKRRRFLASGTLFLTCLLTIFSKLNERSPLKKELQEWFNIRRSEEEGPPPQSAVEAEKKQEEEAVDMHRFLHLYLSLCAAEAKELGDDTQFASLCALVHRVLATGAGEAFCCHGDALVLRHICHLLHPILWKVTSAALEIEQCYRCMFDMRLGERIGFHESPDPSPPLQIKLDDVMPIFGLLRQQCEYRARTNTVLTNDLKDAAERIAQALEAHPIFQSGAAVTNAKSLENMVTTIHLDDKMDPNLHRLRSLPLFFVPVLKKEGSVLRDVFALRATIATQNAMRFRMVDASKKESKMSDLQHAMEAYKKMLLLRPHDASTWAMLGKICLEYTDELLTWSLDVVGTAHKELRQMHQAAYFALLQAIHLQSDAKRKVDASVWYSLGRLWYGALSKPIGGALFQPKGGRARLKKKPVNDLLSDAQRQCGWSFVAKCFLQAIQHPQPSSSASHTMAWRYWYERAQALKKNTATPFRVICDHYFKALALAPESLPTAAGQPERVIDVAYAIISYVTKMYHRGVVPITEAAPTLERVLHIYGIPPTIVSVVPAEMAFWQNAVLLLQELKRMDDKNWHHKPQYRLAWIYLTILDNVDRANEELQTLFNLRSSKKLVTIWRTSLERPGARYAYLYKYTHLYINILSRRQDVDNLYWLTKRIASDDSDLLWQKDLVDEATLALSTLLLLNPPEGSALPKDQQHMPGAHQPPQVQPDEQHQQRLVTAAQWLSTKMQSLTLTQLSQKIHHL